MSNFATISNNTVTSKESLLKIGIIGYGYWGQIISRNLSNSKRVEISYICDGFQGHRKAAELNHPDTQAVADLEEVLDDPEVELVVIATPTNSHYDLARRTLAAGKHVFVEKPFVNTLDQAVRLKTMADKAGKHIFVDHTFIFTSEVQEIKRIVDAGELGEIHMIDSCRMNFGKFQPDVNVAWDLGPHDLSIIHYILGKDPETYYAQGSDSLDRGIEDTVHLSLKFADNLMAYLHLSWISPRKERRFIISGSEKMLIYDDSEPEMKLRLYDNKLIAKECPISTQVQFNYQTGNVVIPQVGGGMALVKEFDYVADVVSGKVEHTLNTANDAIWVMRALTRCDSILRRERMSLSFGENVQDDADVA